MLTQAPAELLGFVVAPTGDHGEEDPAASAGSGFTPDDVNEAFAIVARQGYAFGRPARAIYWKNADSTYWMQWTLEDDAAVLCVYDPQAGKAVAVLRVRGQGMSPLRATGRCKTNQR